MKRLLILAALCLSVIPAFSQGIIRCGQQHMHNALIAQDPSWAQKLEQQRSSLQAEADEFIRLNSQGAAKTTAASAIPVIFHIVVDTTQFIAMGGTAGIIKRCDSQIAVLNADFNKQNRDSTSIPTSWKTLRGNAGIKFGLARKDPSGKCTPGYEIKIISSNGFSNINMAFPEAKTAGTGLPSWDVTKYYNVWCINFIGAASSLLGIAVPPSMAGPFGAANQGSCILYNTLGKVTTGAGSFPAPYNMGRTLTHETGHYLEIWHVWGDDGASGYCPYSSSVCSGSGVGNDDGISDTPPSSEATYGAPTYTITGGTLNDCCKMNGATNAQPIGIPCLDFMDYTNDAAMYLFTPMQAAAMASKVATGGESYSLTQNPSLLVCPTEVTKLEEEKHFSIYPNPTTGEVNIVVDEAADQLTQVIVTDITGKKILTLQSQQKDFYTVDLSTQSKGLYFVQCQFASGEQVVKKVTVQ